MLFRQRLSGVAMKNHPFFIAVTSLCYLLVLVPANAEDNVTDPIYSMTKKEYPEWSTAWIGKANKLMHIAADKVSHSSDCDSLANVSLNDTDSIPNKKIAIWAMCKNDKRFFLTEDELTKRSQAESVITKTAKITDEQAISACMDSVKASLHHPSTFDMSIFGTSVYRAPWGNIATSFDFSAKNSFGLELKYHARCVIDERNANPPEITEK
jgi:hypothetical protein